MDPRTALVMATLLMLLNGGVLGLLHRSLTPDVQPSARDWRIGTLLAAGGTLLLAMQDQFPAAFILPVANGIMFSGLALYWRAIRRFCGQPDRLWVFVPAVVATLGIFTFVALYENYVIRVVLAGFCWAVSLGACAWSLFRHGESMLSRNVLMLIFGVAGSMMAARSVFYLVGAWGTPRLLDGNHWINITTAFIAACLPVIGTTAFLLMCSELIRRRWEEAAATDYLTGLPNRRTITTVGQAQFAEARRNGQAMALAVIDIDHFKSINDRFGHDMGDVALKQVAAVLDQHCRGPGRVGRQGGEEFVALLPGADEAAARAAAERLRAAVEASPLKLGDSLHPLSVSIGLGFLSPQTQSYDSLVLEADHALYRAKQAGRNRVEGSTARTSHPEAAHAQTAH